MCFGQCLQVSARYKKWKPCVSRVLIIKSIMSILRWFERLVSWPVEKKKAIISAVLGILIFVESGLEERLRFLDHLVSSYHDSMTKGAIKILYGILAHDTNL